MYFRIELSLAGRSSLSHETNLKFMGHFFFLYIPSEFSKHKVESHKLFPHLEVVRPKWIFKISENVYNFLTNSKSPAQFPTSGNSQHAETVVALGKGLDSVMRSQRDKCYESEDGKESRPVST